MLLFGIGLIVAVLMGAVILAFVVGFVIIAGIVLWIRVMWMTRKMRRRDPRSPSDGRVIEVEYTVVDESESGPRDSKRRDDH